MAPVIGLYLTAPFIAEFLMGNISIALAFSLPLVGLLYGCGALLIREFARRLGGGWPMIITLGVAYGIYEEAFPVTRSGRANGMAIAFWTTATWRCRAPGCRG